MRFAQIVFGFAGCFGLLMLVPLYFLEARIGAEQPPAITHPEFFYGFAGVGVAWQVAFLFIATDPVRYRPLMIPSVLEKFSFFAAIVTLYLVNRVNLQMLVVSMFDLLMGLLFIASFVVTAARREVSAK